MIGKRIKKQRLKYNLTQRELSFRLGLTPKMISFYENEERTPPADIIIKLSQIFNISTDYILGLSDDNSKKVTVTQKEEVFLSLLRKLDTDYTDIVLGDLKKCVKLQEQEYYNRKKESPQKQA